MLIIAVIFTTSIIHALSWETLPKIPSGRRSQFLVLHKNGGYEYGYDTGDGHSAKQEADKDNKILGQYHYKNSIGNTVDVKYSSAFPHTPIFKSSGDYQIKNSEDVDDGSYQPGKYGDNEGMYKEDSSGEYAEDNLGVSKTQENSKLEERSKLISIPKQSVAAQGTYLFSFATDNQKRNEYSDIDGRVHGRFAYKDNAGEHDLSYIAGSETGFLTTGGSLATPNGLGSNAAKASSALSKTDASKEADHQQAIVILEKSQRPNDSSYSYSFSTDDQSKTETSNSENQVHGRFLYKDKEGIHDLSYVAGAGVGFQPTGGSLAISGFDKSTSLGETNLNGISYKSELDKQGSFQQLSGIIKDGTLNQAKKYGDSLRFLSIPHGFKPLSKIANSNQGIDKNKNVFSGERITSEESAKSNDASYSFTLTAGEVNREEASDTKGSAGSGSLYRNEDGRYVAGTEIGFHPTYGALSALDKPTDEKNFVEAQRIKPAQINTRHSDSSDEDDGSYHPEKYGEALGQYTEDTSGQYVATNDTEDESSKIKASGSSYSAIVSDHNYGEKTENEKSIHTNKQYEHQAGSSFFSGPFAIPSDRRLGNFQPLINDITTSHNLVSTHSSALDATPAFLQANSKNNSYSFSFSSDKYDKHEFSDAYGNVRGRFSYTDAAGKHDLEYVAGSSTGFLPTGGSLATPNGLESVEKAYANSKTKFIPPLGRIVTPPETNYPNIFINPPGGFTMFPPPGSPNIGVIPYSPPSLINPENEIALRSSNDKSKSSTDGSYKFSIDTDEYKRQESSDAHGNIKGNYWYKNSVGNHDLSFLAGSETGFKPVSGSLVLAPGLREDQLLASAKFSNDMALPKNVKDSSANIKDVGYDSGKFKVLANVPSGFGYVYDTGC